jgi:hypothetical protein
MWLVVVPTALLKLLFGIVLEPQVLGIKVTAPIIFFADLGRHGRAASGARPQGAAGLGRIAEALLRTSVTSARRSKMA